MQFQMWTNKKALLQIYGALVQAEFERIDLKQYMSVKKKSINDVKHNLPAQIDGVENQVVDPVHTAYSCVSECSRVFLIELIFDCLARQYKCKVR